MAVLLGGLAVLVALAAASAPTSPSPAHRSLPSTSVIHSVIQSLLKEYGYSEDCVAAALDTCAVTPRESQLVTFIKEARDLLGDVAQAVNKRQYQPRHCKDLQDAGDGESGVRVIHPFPEQPDRRLAVYCDQTTDGGGWTVFQRRTNATVREDFYRTWKEYQLGFGNLETEFWLGLDALHALTSTALQELRVDLADWDGGSRYAKYGFFYVDDEAAKYRLLTAKYSGSAGNNMADRHHGSQFSTHDSDNDAYATGNCAVNHRGAWWYSSCHNSNLNGYQHEGSHTNLGDGINWQSYKGYYYSLRHTTMMVRPAF